MDISQTYGITPMNPFMLVVGLSLAVHLFVIIFTALGHSIRMFGRWMHPRTMIMRYIAVSTMVNVAVFVLMGAGVIVFVSVRDDYSTPRLFIKWAARSHESEVLHAQDDTDARVMQTTDKAPPQENIIQLEPETVTIPFMPPAQHVVDSDGM